MNPLLVSQIHDFVGLSNKTRVYAIKGKAGTGKTQIIKETVSLLTRNNVKNTVLAPTNKACMVLKKRGIDIAKTIHSQLYRHVPRLDEFQQPITKKVLVPLMDPRKPKDFLTDKNGDIMYNEHEKPIFDFVFDPRIDKDTIIIIDESSMVGATEWKNLLELTNYKIIAVGDVNQLEPVETKLKEIKDKLDNYDPADSKESPEELYESYMEEEKLQREYGQYFIKVTANWTETVNKRTSNDAIKNIFESLLTDNKSRWPLPFHATAFAHIYDKSEFDEDGKDLFLLNCDIVIVHKNTTADYLNNRIRELKYPSIFQRLKGFTDGYPHPGENEPLYVEKNFASEIETDPYISIQKGETIRIKEDVSKRLDVKNNILYATIIVESTGEVVENFPIGLNLCGKNANTKLLSCRVSFGYAITCHKAQGSQWNDVLVWDDCNLWGDQKRRWRYTACTRAVTRLSVLIQGAN